MPGKVRVTTEEELKRFKELVAAGACRIPTETATALQLDTLAAALVDLLQSVPELPVALYGKEREVRRGGPTSALKLPQNTAPYEEFSLWDSARKSN